MSKSQSSERKALHGNQQPRYLIAPDADYTDGETCGALSSAYGLTPDPWQQLVLDNWLACDENHMYAADTCGLSVPRQNGKNGVLEMVELDKLTMQHRHILHTAHEVKTCRKAFLRLKSFFEQPEKYPELAEKVKYIRATNGQESIQLWRYDEYGDKVDGGSIEFIARSKSSGRGFTVDDVICDEAQEMTDEQFEVLRSTNSAAPSGNPQLIMTGTPTPPTSPGTVFGRTRRNAIEGNTKRTCWVEWSVDEIGDVRDLSRVEDTNPALGYRLQESVIDSELNSMEPDGFARERLGWWITAEDKTLISDEEWAKLAIGDDDVPIDDYPNKKAFGVKFTPDGMKVAVAVAILQPDGHVHVELVDNGYRLASSGLRWIVDFLDERRNTTAAVAIDGKSSSSALVDHLHDRKYPSKAIMLPGANGMIAASSMLLDAIRAEQLTHYGQQQLTDSATRSQKREIGNQGGWGFDGDECAPIEAASIAYWAVKTTNRNPYRKAVLV